MKFEYRIVAKTDEATGRKISREDLEKALNAAGDIGYRVVPFDFPLIPDAILMEREKKITP